MRIKAIVGTYIGGVIAAIRTEREYKQELKYYSKTSLFNPSEIVFIALHSPLTLYDASEVYPLAQACGVDKYQVVEFSFQVNGDIKRVKEIILKRGRV